MQTFTIAIQARLQWNITITRAGNFLGVCDPIGLSLEGGSEDELRSVIEESLHWFFLTHLEDGTLNAFLASKGWTFTGPMPTKNEIDEGGAVRFDVPVDLVRHAA